MTASEQAKALGLDSLTEVSQMTGISRQHLGTWHNENQNLFKIVLIGCAARKHKSHILNILE